MELRHLRYFIAVAEEGSFPTAAERRLHTAQPSLSRQIRDLESEVGVKLLERKARGVVLTAAGQKSRPQVRGVVPSTKHVFAGRAILIAKAGSNRQPQGRIGCRLSPRGQWLH